MVARNIRPTLMSAFEISEKVAHLRRRESYPPPTRRVEVKETHMSWVFLTETHAYKLKKPARHSYVDYSSVAARRRTCEEEVRLNRRLAPSVYEGIVPLVASERGGLQLGDGSGEIVDWLVKMRRLPEDRMLDRAMALGTVTTEDIRHVSAILAHFYRTAPVAALSGGDYRNHLAAEVAATRQELVRPEYRLSPTLIERSASAQVRALEREPAMFDQRVEAGRVVEAHGDLRPEHICLESRPVIIDCLEFNRDLRVLDAASELAFLWLECTRLGHAEMGRDIFQACSRALGDRPPAALIDFYRGWHACVRAKVAVWHLKDHAVDHAERWIERARHYLQLATDDARAICRAG